MDAKTFASVLNQDTLVGLPLSAYILQLCWPALIKRGKKDPKTHQRYLTVLLAGVALFWAGRSVPALPKQLFDNFGANVRISRWDPLNEALNKWFREHASSKLVATDWKAKSHRHMARMEEEIFQPDSSVVKSASRTIAYTETDAFFFWYKKRLFRCRFMSQPGKSEVDDDGEKVISTLSLTKKPIEQFLEDIWTAHCQDLTSKKTTVWTLIENHWSILALKKSRSLDTVDLPYKEKNRLVKDIKHYFLPSSRARYQTLGVPFRRGYLFHGPPGTGKTSLCLAIAAHFNLQLSVFPLTNPEINDSSLINHFRTIPQPGVLLLEDVDSAGIEREVGFDEPPVPGTVSRGRKSNVTLSGLLNALDGPASPEGTIVVMTTNNLEQLDPALIHAGRVDIRIPFTNLDRDLTLKIFRRFMYDETIKDFDRIAGQFASHIPEGKISPAELQGFLLINGHDIGVALGNIGNWVAEMLSIKEKQEADKPNLAQNKGQAQTTVVAADGEVVDAPTLSQSTLTARLTSSSEISSDTESLTPSNSIGEFVPVQGTVSER